MPGAIKSWWSNTEMHDFAETLNASLLSIFTGMGDHTTESRQIGVMPYYESKYEISCHLGFYDVTGKMAGVALLNIDKNELLQIWAGIWDMPLSREDEAQEIAKELTNMIVANASSMLAKTGVVFRVTLPQIIESGHQIKLSTMKRDNFYYFEFRRGERRFNWVICYYDVIEFL